MLDFFVDSTQEKNVKVVNYQVDTGGHSINQVCLKLECGDTFEMVQASETDVSAVVACFEGDPIPEDFGSTTYAVILPGEETVKHLTEAALRDELAS